MASSTLILKQKTFAPSQKFLAGGNIPVAIKCAEGEPAQIRFSSGISINTTCLGCVDQPCIKYSTEELQMPGAFENFPADKTNCVCASNAITWDAINKKPVIDNSSCFWCGICMSRCPAKALFYKDGEVRVASETSNHFQVAKDPQEVGKANEIRATLSAIKATGSFIKISDQVLNNAYARLLTVSKQMPTQFPNLLSRNLLSAIGLKSAIRRRGDVYSRTDLVFYHGTKYGLCEVEFFPTTMLETPREILDDIAVFVSRYHLEKERIEPLVIGIELPNQRSEFWQVIADIKKVLSVEISTLTIGALFLLIWTQKTALRETDKLPYGDSQSYSIKPGIDRLLEDSFQFANTAYSFFEASK